MLLGCKQLILFMMIAILNHCVHLKLRFIAILYFLIYNILYVAD